MSTPPESRPELADTIDHSAIDGVAPSHWTKDTHPAWMAKDCPHCQRIGALTKAFREFGYTDLRLAEARAAYHVAMTRDTTAEDGIIAMLTRRQLVEARIVP